jgi:hypothetical protein
MERKRFGSATKIAGTLLVVAVLALVTLIAALVLREDGSDTSAAGSVDVGLEQSANGVTLRLDTISQTMTGMELNFTLTLPASIAASSEAEVLGPLFVGDQLRLENIVLPPSGLTIRMKPHLPGETSQPFVLLVDKVHDPSATVTVEFIRLPLRDDADGMLVEGLWRFDIPPTKLPHNPVEQTIDLHQSVTDGQVTVTVSQIEVLRDGLRVSYEIATTNGAPFSLLDEGVRLRHADGRTEVPLTTDRFDQSQAQTGAESSAQFVAVFGHRATASERLTLEFGPFFVGTAQPASIVIQQPLGQASADPVVIAGERFGLAEASYQQEAGQLVVTVANLEQGWDARVVFLGPAAPSVQAQDDQGRSYMVESAGSGMQRADDGTMRAGDSTFIIAGLTNPDVQALTLTVEQSGLLRLDSLTLAFTMP